MKQRWREEEDREGGRGGGIQISHAWAKGGTYIG